MPIHHFKSAINELFVRKKDVTKYVSICRQEIIVLLHCFCCYSDVVRRYTKRYCQKRIRMRLRIREFVEYWLLRAVQITRKVLKYTEFSKPWYGKSRVSI